MRKRDAIRLRKFTEQMAVQVRMALLPVCRLFPERSRERAESVCLNVIRQFAHAYVVKNKLVAFHFKGTPC